MRDLSTRPHGAPGFSNPMLATFVTKAVLNHHPPSAVIYERQRRIRWNHSGRKQDRRDRKSGRLRWLLPDDDWRRSIDSMQPHTARRRIRAAEKPTDADSGAIFGADISGFCSRGALSRGTVFAALIGIGTGGLPAGSRTTLSPNSSLRAFSHPELGGLSRSVPDGRGLTNGSRTRRTSPRTHAQQRSRPRAPGFSIDPGATRFTFP